MLRVVVLIQGVFRQHVLMHCNKEHSTIVSNVQLMGSLDS